MKKFEISFLEKHNAFVDPFEFPTRCFGFGFEGIRSFQSAIIGMAGPEPNLVIVQRSTNSTLCHV